MSADLLLGGSSFKIFSAAPMRDPRMSDVPLFVVVGLLTGAVGVLYNRAVMSSLKLVDASRPPREVRAGVIGGLVGLVGYYAPSMIGGGDQLTQRALLGAGSIAVVGGVLVLRFALSVVSYAAATPGGIFAPMLVIGSHLGLLVGLVGRALIPSMTPEPAALALIGMAAFFTATVRAPITGIVLATELTGVTNQLPPTLGACAIAMLVAMMLRCTPIYDALTTRAAIVSPAERRRGPSPLSSTCRPHRSKRLAGHFPDATPRYQVRHTCCIRGATYRCDDPRYAAR